MKAPILKLMPGLCLGIILQFHFNNSLFFIFWISIACLVYIFSFRFFSLSFRYRFHWLPSFFWHGLLMAFGMLLVSLGDPRNDNNFFVYQLHDDDLMILKLNEEPRIKEKTITATADVLEILQTKNRISAKGKLSVTILKKGNMQMPHAGDCILISKHPQPMRHTSNPGGFDFASQQELQYIYHSVFLYPNDFRIISNSKPSRWQEVIQTLKKFTVSHLEKYIGINPEVIGIAEALLIGYKVNLDQELNQTYSKTGVVHIIAISGLHLGLIYASLQWLLGWIPLIRQRAVFRGAILLLCLWTFTLMSGASASVLRSAVMFTCIIVGEMMNRRSSIYNSLAASALILLCIRPAYLFDIGFQLSYLAIAGILWWQKPIQRCWQPRFFIFKKLWEMCSITIAAQLMAFPICIYYFHQFPNYFLPANLIAVPLSTIILFVEILLLICSPFPVVASGIGKCCEMLILSLNRIIHFIADLPWASIEHLQINYITTIFIYLFIIFLLAALMYKRIVFFRMTLISALMMSFFIMIQIIQWKKQSMLVVYNIRNMRLLDVIDGQNSMVFEDSTMASSNNFPHQDVIRCHDFFGVKANNSKFHLIGENPTCFTMGNKTIICLDGREEIRFRNMKNPVNLIILSHADKMDMEALKRVFHPQTVILDGTNPLWKIADIRSRIEALHLQCFSVAEQGAFVLRFS